ncbi:MAG: integrase core domain-containing protein [Hyphomicrobium sp.]
MEQIRRRRLALHPARKPLQNAFVECLNGRPRDELFNESLFSTLGEARELLAA